MKFLTSKIFLLFLLVELSLSSKSEEACKSFGKLPMINVDRNLESYKAQFGEFPEAAALGYLKENNKTKFVCNGVLISEKFVLTAAHCVNDKNNRPISVRLGKTSLIDDNSDPSIPVDVDIKSIILHPNYQRSKKIIENNIALIQLESPVKFNDYIRPACLNNVINDTTKDLISIGWGEYALFQDDNQDGKISTWLLKNNGKELETDACKEKYKDLIHITGDHLCFQAKPGNVEICRGSSGSFLGTIERNQHIVHGVTSFGVTHCGSHFATFFSRVSSNINWIEAIVWPEEESIHEQ